MKIILGGCLTTTAQVSEAATEADGEESIAVVVVGPSGYTQPICSKCPKLKVWRQTTAAGEGEGTLELDYYLDETYLEFEGTIKATIWSVDGSSFDVLTIDDVWLAEGDQAVWRLDDAPLLNETNTVWVEFVPTVTVP